MAKNLKVIMIERIPQTERVVNSQFCYDHRSGTNMIWHKKRNKIKLNVVA